ncbi:hypothetical protein KSF_097700 [Reticulibacter mediterranei]|uniref:Uncharacterized protein n=1 Tax=Reticulibacter mediterranei TaxID=2778369 RepID=A0A8J3N9V3_9CHLR|nr:hypothetical protein [Reticulibacter mediterranei]GHO99722.1 hypothetical protein KSF_097700 [Reticulibacter mediterranei]
MTQTFVEALILIPSTLTTGYLMWIATVLQRVLNDIDESSFGRFIPLLYRHAIRSVYTVFTSSITFVAMIPYFIFYGFNHWWFIAGLLFFVLSSVAGKLLNLPVYSRISALGSDEVTQLKQERQKLQTANLVRAWLCLISTILMMLQFA